MAEQKHVTIYSDGACLGNPGPGGFGVVLLYAGKRRELSGGFKLTTNNRMELIAAIRGLEALKELCTVTLISDSDYLVKGMQKRDAIRKGGRRSRRKMREVPNTDLWTILLHLCSKHKIEFQWVRGHDGNPENERCDKLAQAAIKNPTLEEDKGYMPASDSLLIK